MAESTGIAERLAEVKKTLKEGVTLIAVSKTKPYETTIINKLDIPKGRLRYPGSVDINTIHYQPPMVWNSIRRLFYSNGVVCIWLRSRELFRSDTTKIKRYPLRKIRS